MNDIPKLEIDKGKIVCKNPDADNIGFYQSYHLAVPKQDPVEYDSVSYWLEIKGLFDITKCEDGFIIEGSDAPTPVVKLDKASLLLLAEEIRQIALQAPEDNV